MLVSERYWHPLNKSLALGERQDDFKTFLQLNNDVARPGRVAGVIRRAQPVITPLLPVRLRRRIHPFPLVPRSEKTSKNIHNLRSAYTVNDPICSQRCMGRFSEFEIRLPAMLHSSPKLMDLGPKERLSEMKADHFEAILISDAIMVVVSRLKT
ncbi:unnamed protein product, partial [Brenthis ino]